jgi:hypothetical protein
MVLRSSPLYISLILTTLAGCAKSSPVPQPASPPLEKAAPGTTPEDFGGCDPRVVTDILSEISKSESDRAALDAIAKKSPDQSNFRALYEAELKFIADGETKTKKLTACGAGSSAIMDLKEKIAKARTDLNYLNEVFPDFK